MARTRKLTTRATTRLLPQTQAALQDKTNTSRTLRDSSIRQEQDTRSDEAVKVKAKGRKAGPAREKDEAISTVNATARHSSATTRTRQALTETTNRQPGRPLKVHKPPRMTRKPISTLKAINKGVTISVDEIEEVDSGQNSVRRPARSRQLEMSAIRHNDETQQVEVYEGSQVPETVYQSSGKASATPLERSMLVLKNFRRRPRQPSMLTMVKQRLASARSSLAGAMPENALELSDDDLSSLEDFLPDAAGTPLNPSTGDLMAFEPVQASRSFTSSAESQKRKRASLPEAISRESPKRHKPRASTSTRAPNATMEHEVLSDNDSETDSAHITSPRSPSTTILDQEIYGEPLTQVTPPRQTRTKTTKPAASTAVLQSLLPKRRKQVKSAFTAPTLHLPAADDEGQWSIRSSPSIEVDMSEYSASKRRGRSSLRLDKRDTRALHTPKATIHDREGDQAKQPSRKYGRGTASGKENAAPDVEFQITDKTSKASKELEAARKKFAEVDQWEMEFEIETTETSRTSSQGWR